MNAPFIINTAWAPSLPIDKQKKCSKTLKPEKTETIKLSGWNLLPHLTWTICHVRSSINVLSGHATLKQKTQKHIKHGKTRTDKTQVSASSPHLRVLFFCFSLPARWGSPGLNKATTKVHAWRIGPDRQLKWTRTDPNPWQVSAESGHAQGPNPIWRAPDQSKRTRTRTHVRKHNGKNKKKPTNPNAVT